MHLILSFLQVLEMAISVSVKLYKRVKGKSKFRLTRDFCFLLPLLFLRCGLYSVFSSDSIDLAQLIVALYISAFVIGAKRVKRMVQISPSNTRFLWQCARDYRVLMYLLKKLKKTCALPAFQTKLLELVQN
jgi:hypothetical protein